MAQKEGRYLCLAILSMIDHTDKEYKRDRAKNLHIEIPKNYYPDDNPEKKPLLLWRSHSILYSKLNYYVYQVTLTSYKMFK